MKKHSPLETTSKKASDAIRNIVQYNDPQDISNQQKIELIKDAAKIASKITVGLSETQPHVNSASRQEGLSLERETLHKVDSEFSTFDLRYIPASDEIPAARCVAIDAINIVPGISGGVEIYMKTLVRAILVMPNHRATIVCLPQYLEHYRSVFGDDVAYCVPHVRPVESNLYELWTESLDKKDLSFLPYFDVQQHSFRWLSRISNACILHSPIQIFSYFDSGLPSVLNLHDLQHLHMPENFTKDDLIARNELYGRSAAAAAKIIASSEFVANDISKKMGISSSRIATIPVTWNPDLDVNMTEGRVEEITRSYNLPENFIFFPGQFWKHKNHANLIRAFATSRRANPKLDLHLVLTGYRGHSGWPLAAEAIAAEGVDEKVVCLDYIPVSDLPAIYKSAIACIMPSLFEASSYPVIEAQRMKCAAACSNVTSLPELMKDGAGLLFDPNDIQSISKSIDMLCSDINLREAIIEKAYRRVIAENSMQAYAESLLKIYESLQSTVWPRQE